MVTVKFGPRFITDAYVNCTTSIATRWHHRIINLHAVADPTLGGIVGYVNLVWRGVECRSSCSKGQFRYVLFGFILQPLSMELYLTAFAFVCSWECIVIVPGLELIELVATVRLCSEKDKHATINYIRVQIQR